MAVGVASVIAEKNNLRRTERKPEQRAFAFAGLSVPLAASLQAQLSRRQH